MASGKLQCEHPNSRGGNCRVWRMSTRFARWKSRWGERPMEDSNPATPSVNFLFFRSYGWLRRPAEEVILASGRVSALPLAAPKVPEGFVGSL